jgi:hypothetical protein
MLGMKACSYGWRFSSLLFVTLGSSIHHINLLFTDIYPVSATYSLENASLNKRNKKYPPSSASIFGIKEIYPDRPRHSSSG